MASWIGLEILIPKHPWKSKIGLLQTILAAKRYVSFFLGHPVLFSWFSVSANNNKNIIIIIIGW